MPEVEASNEIRLTRVYDAPAHVVWDAWTVPEQVEKWWGPRGFTLTTHSKDLRPGGTWRYTMHGPDGVDYPNVTTYHEVVRHQKLVYDHGATDETPPLFRVTVAFTEHDGRTTMEMTSTLPTPEAAREMAKFVKQAGGYGTWDRLADYLAQRTTGTQPFVIHRTLEAPIARVFEMWTTPERLTEWLPPPGARMRLLRGSLAPDESAWFAIEGEGGSAHVRFDYARIEAPQRIEYTHRFVDAEGQRAPSPFGGPWPPALRTTVRFTAESPERTRMALTYEVDEGTTQDELDAFVRARPSMTLGWMTSFDNLGRALGCDVEV